MLTLVFDTETTGFLHKTKPIGHPSQPHLIQLAFAMVKDNAVEHTWSTIIHCPIDVPQGAFAVHGISREKSQEVGVPLVDAVFYFDKFLKMCERFVCHNSEYDFPIMQNAYHRCGFDQTILNSRAGHCTMKSLTPVLKLLHKSGRTGYKWPTLKEAYEALTDPSGFSGAHDALADVGATVSLLQFIETNGKSLVQTHNHGVTTV